MHDTPEGSIIHRGATSYYTISTHPVDNIYVRFIAPNADSRYGLETTDTRLSQRPVLYIIIYN